MAGRMNKRGAWALLLALVLVAVPSVPAHAVGFALDEPSTATEGEAAGTGYIPSAEPVLSVHDGATSGPLLLQSAPLPAAYSSVDAGAVTAPKNQGSKPLNTCWAFSTLGSLEAQVLANNVLPGEDATTLDLSERHLAYFTFNTQSDPLGNTAGDSTTPRSDTYLSAGGNDMMAAYALASWMGAAREDDLPTYEELRTSYTSERHSEFDLDSSLSHSVDYLHLSGVRRIAMADATDIKQAIRDNGAVSASVYYANDHYQYLDSTTYAMYVSDSSLRATHAILLVGWDDNYPVDNFRVRPSRPGAWLVRNSWGADWGNDGYFWVSYEDQVLSNGNAYLFMGEPAENLDNIYQYDGSSSMFYNYVESGGSVANVYTAASNPDGVEELSSVGLSLTAVNVQYHIQVYVGLRDATDPTSGDPQLATPLTGTTSYEGYYTFELPEPVVLEQGDTFSVVATLSKDTGEMVGYDVDRTYAYSWVSFVNEVAPGQSFEQDRAGGVWEDLSSLEQAYPSQSCDREDEVQCSARIKAFTNNVGGDKPRPTRYAYRLAVSPENRGTITSDISSTPVTTTYATTVVAGTSDTLTATPDAGYAFVRWEDGNGNELGTEATYSVTVDADTRVVAVFEELAPRPIYRMYNTRTSEHLYTTSVAEYGMCGKGAYVDWRAEGIAWYAPVVSTTPVYRLYNLVSGDHHYTNNSLEKRTLLASGDWRDEGTAFYSDDAQRVALYRLYNRGLRRGQHHYTASENERDVLVDNHGWSDEGIGFYGVRAR